MTDANDPNDTNAAADGGDAGNGDAGDGAATGSDVTIADVPIRGRYEALVDGTFAGWVEYRRMGRRLVAVHTEVLPAFGGRGISSLLVRRVIADARAAGLRISPICPLFQAHFRRHPEDQDVLAPGRLPG